MFRHNSLDEMVYNGVTPKLDAQRDERHRTTRLTTNHGPIYFMQRARQKECLTPAEG
jgi:hypothetical protein